MRITKRTDGIDPGRISFEDQEFTFKESIESAFEELAYTHMENLKSMVMVALDRGLSEIYNEALKHGLYATCDPNRKAPSRILLALRIGDNEDNDPWF